MLDPIVDCAALPARQPPASSIDSADEATSVDVSSANRVPTNRQLFPSPGNWPSVYGTRSQS